MVKDFSFDKPNGEGWLLRAYKSLDDLVPLEKPDVSFAIKPFPIRWEQGDKEGPNWEDARGVVDGDTLGEFFVLEDDEDLYYSRYQNSDRTKLGGWPALIQHELQMKQDEFLFQVGSEEKAHWIWVDSGVGYFGLDDSGDWKFECQFF